MLFKSAIISTFALCMASHTLGAAIDSPVQDIEARDALIATDPSKPIMDPKQAKAETEPVAKPIPITDPNNVFYTDDKGVKHRICLPPPGTRLKSAQPNCMWYTDDKGVERSIYLPQGTMHTAWEHRENKRWDELAKFEPYTDQGYTEDDFKASEERHKQLEGQEK